MLMEYSVCSLRIVVIIDMVEVGFVEEILLDLVQLEEEHLVACYHHNDEKERQKSWHFYISRISNFTSEILFSSMTASF